MCFATIIIQFFFWWWFCVDLCKVTFWQCYLAYSVPTKLIRDPLKCIYSLGLLGILNIFCVINGRFRCHSLPIINVFEWVSFRFLIKMDEFKSILSFWQLIPMTHQIISAIRITGDWLLTRKVFKKPWSL